MEDLDKGYKRIWLQIGGGQEDEYMTWETSKVNKTDVEYIRADVVRQREKDLLKNLENKMFKYGNAEITRKIVEMEIEFIRTELSNES